MPETIKMLLVLTLISGAAGFGLSAMNDLTTPVIKENQRQFTLKSINDVLPNEKKPDACKKYDKIFDNSPDSDAICIGTNKLYRGRVGDEVVAVAIEAIGKLAYSGTIKVLVGIRMRDGMIIGLKVLEHKETPGLGSLIKECNFQQQLVGNTTNSIKWSVVKDNGDVNQLSGATISSRSMLFAIKEAQNIWKNHKKEILENKPISQEEVCNVK